MNSFEARAVVSGQGQEALGFQGCASHNPNSTILATDSLREKSAHINLCLMVSYFHYFSSAGTSWYPRF